MQHVAERIVNGVLAVFAVVAIVVLVRRELASSGVTEPPTVEARQLSAEDWEAAKAAARFSVAGNAHHTLLEFVDVECPFCRQYVEVVENVRERSGSGLAVGYVHLPLPQHRFALPGARALECAHAQESLEPLLHGLLHGQDSLGLKSWIAFAADAGVEDLSEFEGCNSGSDTSVFVAAGWKVARALRVTGTPTLVLNGWLFASLPSEEQLTRVLVELESGSTMAKALSAADVSH